MKKDESMRTDAAVTNLEREAINVVVPEIVDDERPSLLDMPTGPMQNVIIEVMGVGFDDLKTLKKRKLAISHSCTFDGKITPSFAQVQVNTSSSFSYVRFNKILPVLKKNIPAIKLFVFAMIKAGEQMYRKGELVDDKVVFSLQNLVDYGMYANMDAARKGFKNNVATLKGLEIEGKIFKKNDKKNDKKKIIPVVERGESVITGWSIKNNVCMIRFNYAVNWALFMSYFTVLPRYFFKMSERGSALLLYIFSQARMNIPSLQKNGYFTVSFRSIQARLNLPDEKETKNPRRTIFDPIEAAVTEIEEIHYKEYNTDEIKLEPVYPENTRILQILEEGRLKVYLSGSFMQRFVELSKRTQNKIERVEKLQEGRIRTKIKAKANREAELEYADKKKKEAEGAKQDE